MRDQLAVQAAELVRARVPFAQAIVVRAQHPTSAHAGDTALVFPDGRIEGFVGGTCAEESVRLYGLRVLDSGEPVLLRVLPGPASTVEEDGAVTVANPCVSGGALEIFLQPRRPLPRVLVVGETPVASALVAMAEPAGFAAEAVAGAGVTPSPDDAGMVVASHGRDEEPALEAALRAGVPYVALVGSRIRAASVLGRLDVPDADRARVRSPAGLDIGARSAGEIAVSILAELVSERARPRLRLPAGPAAPTGREVPAGPVGSAAVWSAVPAPRPAEPGREAQPASAVDPVCGMTVSTAGSPLTAEHAGATVHFCGEHCRVAFAADPDRYAGAR